MLQYQSYVSSNKTHYTNSYFDAAETNLSGTDFM